MSAGPASHRGQALQALERRSALPCLLRCQLGRAVGSQASMRCACAKPSLAPQWHRAKTVPGIGPIISSAMVAAIGSGAAFAKGRDYSAWLGLVPKQMSTGDRTILGHISKRGNGYLRMLFIQAARVILVRPANWPKHGFGAWLVRAAQRLHPNVLAVALANKLARIAWTVLAQERSYEARVMK